ncbi:oligosaccharide flippase family protein [Lachnospiraceae bacterium OttesenSCG-928-D06]|nr:oligosaccharide flippase family protein [Lachnospiraceae bacterium OttesenSCG-928-D06]
MNRVEVKRRQIEVIQGIFSLIIVIVMGRMLGNSGIAYAAAAYFSLLLFETLVTSSVPDSLGKLIRSRNQKSQYKNVTVVKNTILIYQCVIGILGSLILYGLANVFERYVFCMPNSALIIKVLSPVIFIKSISSVIQGYFKGSGIQTPSIIMGVLRRIFFFGFSLIFFHMFWQYGEKVSALLKNTSFSAMYGAVAFAFSYVITEILLLVFVIFLYLFRRKEKKEKEKDGLRLTENIGTAIQNFYHIMIPEILIKLLAIFPLFAGLFLYQRSIEDISLSIPIYGAYIGQYVIICLIPIGLILCIIYPSCARIVSFYKKEEQRLVEDIFGSVLIYVSALACMFTIFFTVLSPHLVKFLFPLTGEAASFIQSGSLIILTVSLNLFFLMLLKLNGKPFLGIILLFIQNVLFTGISLLFLKAFSMGTMGIVYALLISSSILALSSGFFVVRQLNVSLYIISYVIMLGVLVVVGLIIMGLKHIMSPHLGNGMILLLCFLVLNILYWPLLLFAKSFKKEVLNQMPGGALLVWIGKLMKIYR